MLVNEPSKLTEANPSELIMSEFPITELTNIVTIMCPDYPEVFHPLEGSTYLRALFEEYLQRHTMANEETLLLPEGVKILESAAEQNGNCEHYVHKQNPGVPANALSNLRFLQETFLHWSEIEPLVSYAVIYWETTAHIQADAKRFSKANHFVIDQIPQDAYSPSHIGISKDGTVYSKLSVRGPLLKHPVGIVPTSYGEFVSIHRIPAA